jgi:hypothetical protein
VGGGFRNSAASDYATIGGGQSNAVQNSANHATIDGGQQNVIEANASYATIGGGQSNVIQGNANHATIAGGQQNVIMSVSTGATIGGGGYHLIRSDSSHATVSGGFSNVMRESCDGATIGGGYHHLIGLDAEFATVGGGFANVIDEDACFATIPDGQGNYAGAPFAFAAGRRAHAGWGSFVWGDSTDAEIASTNINSWTVRASGGVRFFSTSNATMGVILNAGEGSWSALSDRNAKTNFAAVNPQEVLRRVVALPIQTWNYRGQEAAVRHIGPTAQDFHAALGVGTDDRHITTVDADGVALAAIQGLNQRLEAELQQKAAEIQSLKQSLAELKETVKKMTAPTHTGISSAQ